LSGAPVITAFYRQSPYWPRIQLHEARFQKFLQEFCVWKVKDDEGKPGASEILDAETEDTEQVDV
jgi:hypothetical protein